MPGDRVGVPKRRASKVVEPLRRRGNSVGELALDALKGVRDTKHGGLLAVRAVAHPSSSQKAAFSAREAQDQEQQEVTLYLNGVRS